MLYPAARPASAFPDRAHSGLLSAPVQPALALASFRKLIS